MAGNTFGGILPGLSPNDRLKRMADNQAPGTITTLTGLSLVEYGTVTKKTVFTFSAVALTVTDPATVLGLSQQLYAFPAGLIHVSASTNLTLTAASGISATAAILGALGTVAAANDTTLTSTEANIIPSTTCTLAASAGVFKGESTGIATIDGTTTGGTAPKAILNFVIPDAALTANSTLTISGTLTLVWWHVGDN